ncbi:hypothetical protein [Pectobacterium brasiliense]|uniref:hypothetical protein n=1 Tax=Pectobacterium brasiliense TaxID=180957 RepID=UPI0025A2ACF7|nr:hypothetical protein [Pectobacterium brasiliense]WJM80820.1 hypothetical protein QTI90_21660 [Pectobacterium brasiliense]
MFTNDTTSFSHADGNARVVLDEQAWQVVCKTAAIEASRYCGLAYDHYIVLLSSSIDQHVDQLPEHLRAQALKIARKWDYATPAERQETQDWNAENGYCRHGLDPNCCPAGCSEY